MESELNKIISQLNDALLHTTTLEQLDALETEYMGRKGKFNAAASELAKLSIEDKKSAGVLFNKIKSQATVQIQVTKDKMSKDIDKDLLKSIDTSIPGTHFTVGQLHPTTRVIRRINSFFRYLGYSVYDGPEIETDEYNFQKLNVPSDHPARELQDTLYIAEPEYLLRTQTSSVEVRAMMKEKLPFRIVVPGKVYRNETASTTNNAMFYQYQGVAIGEKLNMSHLKGTLTTFAQFLYGSEIKTRFRCKYYPEVEPGAGMDIQCNFCGGIGCQVCKYRGWIEVLGSGMIHPNTLASCGIDKTKYSGFAFGLGLDRLVMLSYKIDDIRKLYNGELIVKQSY